MGRGAKKKIPLIEIDKGLKLVCVSLEKDIKAQKLHPKTAYKVRCSLEAKTKKIMSAAKKKANKDGTIDPEALKQASKSFPKLSLEVTLTEEEATMFSDRKIKLKPTPSLKVSPDVSFGFTPSTLELQNNKPKLKFTPTLTFKINLP